MITRQPEDTGRWGTVRPGRRDVLRGVGIAGAFLGVDLGVLLYASSWIAPVPRCRRRFSWIASPRSSAANRGPAKIMPRVFRLPAGSTATAMAAGLFWVLRQAHSIVAYALMAVIAAHISAIVLHTVTLHDRMIDRMTFRLARARSGPKQR